MQAQASKGKIPVRLPYGTLATAMDWCRENCRGGWGLSDSITDTAQGGSECWDDYSTIYWFEFEDERDYIAFSLKYR